MNIGIVTTWCPAGVGYVSKAYFESLSKFHNLFIYARGGKILKGNSGWDAKYVYWGPQHPYGIRMKSFLRWIKRERIDILFFNEQRYWKPVLEAKKLGVICGAYIDYYTQKTVKAFALYDFLICNTKRHFSVFNWHKHCFYLHWGTDIDKYKPSNSKPLRPLTFINSAGWQGKSESDRRGTLLVLKALRKIKRDCRLIIYSQINLDQCIPEWQEQIRNDKRIIFVSGTFEPFPYGEGDVFVYPSRLDGIGLTLPEALSCGLPAITTDSPPMNEFVKNDVNGSLVRVEKYLGRHDGYYWAESICNEDALAEAMMKYFDYNILFKQSRNAREIAEKNLSWSKNDKNLNQIFSNADKYQTSLSEGLINLVNSLDNEILPSIQFRIKSLIYHLLESF